MAGSCTTATAAGQNRAEGGRRMRANRCFAGQVAVPTPLPGRAGTGTGTPKKAKKGWELRFRRRLTETVSINPKNATKPLFLPQKRWIEPIKHA